jgi:hypothetical protein
LAAERGHLEVVRRLISLEAVDVKQTVWHKSPLFIGIENGYRGVSNLLLDQGNRLDVNAKTFLGGTAYSSLPLTGIWISCVEFQQSSMPLRL